MAGPCSRYGRSLSDNTTPIPERAGHGQGAQDERHAQLTRALQTRRPARSQPDRKSTMIAPRGCPIDGATTVVQDHTHTPGLDPPSLRRTSATAATRQRRRSAWSTGGLVRDSQLAPLTGRLIGSIAVNRRAVAAERAEELCPDVVDACEEEVGVTSRLTRPNRRGAGKEGTPCQMFAGSPLGGQRGSRHAR